MILQPVGIGQEASKIDQVSMHADEPVKLDLSDLFPDGTGYPVPVDLIIRNKAGSIRQILVNTSYGTTFIMGDRDFEMHEGDILRIMATERIVFLNGKPAGIYVLYGDYPVMGLEDLSITILTDADAELEVTARCAPRWI